MRPGDKVRASQAGLVANPELAGRVGVILEIGEAVELAWNGSELSCWLKTEFVEVPDPSTLTVPD